MAAMVGMGAYAQSWTSDAVGEGYYVLYNVGKNMFFTRGNGWSTQASVNATNPMTVQLSKEDDDYFIRTGVDQSAYGLEHLKGTVYTDQSRDKRSSWTFTQVGTDNGPVYNIISAGANHNGGAGTYLTASSDNTIVGEGADGSSDYAKWKLMKIQTGAFRDALVTEMAGATELSPVDVTLLIADANFGAGKHIASELWTTEASNLDLNGGDMTNPVAESWKSAFDVRQTITVPNGYYRLRVQGFIRETGDGYTETGTDYPVVFINNEATGKPFIKMVTETASLGTVSSYFANGDGTEYYWTDWTESVKITSKSITIGVKGTRNNSWCAWDNFQLQYLGPLDLSEYVAGLADAVSAAAATEGTIPTACYDAIDAVVTEYNKVYDNEEDYTDAIIAINSAVSTYASSDIVAAYTRYTSIRSAVRALNSGIDVSAADDLANDGTDADLDDAVTSVRAALVTYLAGAGITDDQIDLTSALIDNASPGTAGKTDYWTNSNAPSLQANLYEFYNISNATSKQTIATELPIGYYKLTVIGYTRDESYDGYIFAGGNSQTLVGAPRASVNNRTQGDTWIADGNGVNEMTFRLESATSNLEIGVNSGTVGDKWTCWRSFKLEYLGTAPLNIFKDMLQATIDASRTTVAALSVPTGVKNTFTAVADGYETAKAGYTTVAECVEASANVEAAVATAQAAVAPTAMNGNIKAKAVTTAALTELDDADEAVLQAVIDANDATLDACTDVAGIEAQNAALWAAIDAAIATIDLTGDETLDLTYLLTNPNLEGLPTWTGADGWYTDQSEGNSQVMTNTKVTSSDETKTAFYEYWTWTAQANNKFALYQKVNLPEGTYSINCYAFARQQDDPANTGDKRGVKFYANDTEGSAVYSDRLSEASIDFVNESTQEVKIGLKTTSPNSYNWMGIGYVTLTKVAPVTVTIDEDVDYTPESKAGLVTLNRTFNADKWNTFVVPFAISNSELTAAFGAGVKVAEFSDGGASDAEVEVVFTEMTTPAITANKPVLLKTSTASTSFEFANRTITTDSPVATGTYVDFVGTYAASITIAAGNYFISGNKLWKSAGTTTMKGTRAYIDAKVPVPVKLFIGDTETSIEEINGMEAENGVIYNLAGQRISKMQKGINIINGRKVLY